MKIQTLSGIDSLDESRWNSLLAASSQPSVFMTWQWQAAWLRGFGGGRPVQLLAASDATESLVALLPLPRVREAPLVEAVLAEPMSRLAAQDAGVVAAVAAAARRSRRQSQSRAPSGTARGSPT